MTAESRCARFEFEVAFMLASEKRLEKVAQKNLPQSLDSHKQLLGCVRSWFEPLPDLVSDHPWEFVRCLTH